MKTVRKSALGKGLGALIDDVSKIDDVTVEEPQGVKEIDISLIDRDENQPRKRFDDEKLEELAASLKTHGVMQPLIVVRRGGRYTIVAGERRYRAARKAGLKKLPVIVKELSDQDVLEVSLIENIQREDLNAIEQAEALISLMEKYDITQEQASERVGKSRSAIANLVRLASLPESIKDLVREDRLSPGHARALLPLKNEAVMKGVASRIINMNLSVRQTEAMIKKMLEERPAPKKTAQPAPEWIDAMRKLSESLDTRVRFSGNEDKGKIIIDYYSKEQLQELFDKLS